MAKECSPIKRAAFKRRISSYPANYLISLDEVSKDDRTYARIFGHARRGERVEAISPFVCGHRFSMLAAMALDEGIVALHVVEGSFNREMFMEFLRDDLVCALCLIPPISEQLS